MADRANALLTESQREKLTATDEEPYSRQHRQRVRERTRNGTKDLALLFEHMEERDIRQVFEPNKDVLEETADILNQVVQQTRQQNRGRPELRDIEDILEDLSELLGELATVEKELDDIQYSERVESGDGIENRHDELGLRESKLQEQRDRIVEELQVRLEESTETLEATAESVEERQTSIERVSVKELDQEHQSTISDIHEKLTARQRIVRQASDIVNELRETLGYSTIEQDDILYLQGQVVELLDEIADHDSEQHPLRHIVRHLRRDIQSELQTPEFDPAIRDDVVDALAFFFRVSTILNTATEELIEEALLRMYDQERTDDVVEHVVVSTEFMDRQDAARQAAIKGSDERLSNAELRALAEEDPRSLINRYATEPEITDATLLSLIKKNPETLEDGLEILDTDPYAPRATVVPDLIAKDTNGNTVVIEVKTDVTGPSRVQKRFQRLIDSYGGSDRVRGFLVIPESVADDHPDLPSVFDDVPEVKILSVRDEWEGY